MNMFDFINCSKQLKNLLLNGTNRLKILFKYEYSIKHYTTFVQYVEIKKILVMMTRTNEWRTEDLRQELPVWTSILFTLSDLIQVQF